MKPFLLSLLLTSLFLTSLESLAEIHFIKPKNEAWKQETLALIHKMNDFLPESIKKPNTFNVAYVEGADAAYYHRFNFIDENGAFSGIDRVIIVGDQLEGSFIHEYGHLIFDNHLRFTFPLWQFHVISSEVASSDLEHTAKDFEQAIVSLMKGAEKYKLVLEKDENDAFAKKALKNITRSLDTYVPRVARLKHAIKIQADYEIDLSTINQFTHLISYNELFADFFAVSFAKDWSYMKKSVIQSVESDNDPTRFTFPPAEDFETAVELMGQMRDFRSDIEVASYQYRDWEKNSPYWEFSPTKSYLRQMVEGGTESQIALQCLLNSIMSIHQNWVESGANFTPTLLEKNDLLIGNVRSSCL